MYKYYPVMMILRLLSNAIIIGLVITNQMSMVTYFLCDLAIGALMSKSIACCTARMKRYVYNGPNREKFDNYKHFGVAIAGTIGNGIALLGIPETLAWTLLLLSVIVDTVCSLMQYKEIKMKLKEAR